MNVRAETVFVVIVWAVLALHAAALVAILFAAASSRANAARLVREPAPAHASGESPARPGCNPAPSASFNVQRSAFSVKRSGASCAPARNPAIAGSRHHSGPGFCFGYPVKQYAVPNLAATLPAVAG